MTRTGKLRVTIRSRWWLRPAAYIGVVLVAAGVAKADRVGSWLGRHAFRIGPVEPDEG